MPWHVHQAAQHIWAPQGEATCVPQPGNQILMFIALDWCHACISIFDVALQCCKLPVACLWTSLAWKSSSIEGSPSEQLLWTQSCQAVVHRMKATSRCQLSTTLGRTALCTHVPRWCWYGLAKFPTKKRAVPA